MNTKLTVKEFNEEVLNGKGLRIVQFKTEWNGACQIIAPIYDDLARLYKNVANFFTIDADKQKRVTDKFRINETPTILFFENGNVIDFTVGLISKDTLISKIEKALSQNKN